MSDWVVARVDGGTNILYTIISLVGRGWGWVGGDEGWCWVGVDVG
jgi:hypothetical protein